VTSRKIERERKRVSQSPWLEAVAVMGKIRPFERTIAEP
jgi:hypothetical protein